MRLTAIRLHGFKSFADATVFPVDAAVTGIIGPNGCGKSNIIDAVRWVLGESTAKQLRGASMADVIFAGSSGRKAAAQASVELHFDNTDGSAGGAFASYAELVVKRSVQSDGSSHYFINRERCRRRDIVELLQGTGVGARSYAVIEQGMVGRIVESKPEDLRAFVEEAAGVALYRSRRRDSERRMNEVRELLNRHEDRLQQLAKNRERLEKEAAAAERYRALQGELSGHEYRLQSWRLHRALAEQHALDAQYHAQENAFADSLIAAERSQQHVDAERERLRHAETAFAPLQSASQHAQAALGAQQAEHARLQTQRDYAARHAQQLRERRDKLKAQQQQDSGESQAHRDALTLLDATLAELHAQQDSARAQYDASTEHARAARSRLDQAIALRDQHQQLLSAEQARLDTLQRQHDALQQRLAQSTAPEEDIDDDHLQTLALQAESAAIAVEDSAYALQTLQDEHKAEQHALEHARERLRHAEQSLTALQSRIETLEQWQEHSPDLPENWQNLAPLASQLRVHAPWQDAVERYLDSALHALCGALLPAQASARGQAFALEGSIPPAWQHILESPYGLHTWFADLEPLEVFDDALDLAQLPPNKRYLTLSGSIASHSGLQPARGTHAGILARLAQLQALRDEWHSQSAQHQAISAELQQRETQAAARQHAWQTLVQQQQKNQQAQQRLEHALLLARQKNAHQREMAAQHTRIRQSLHEDLAHNREEQTRLQAHLAALQHEHHDLTELQNAWQHAEHARAHNDAQLKQITAQTAQGEQEKLRHQSWLDAQTHNAQRAQDALTELHQALEHEDQTLADSQIALEDSALALEHLRVEAENAEHAREHAFAALGAQRDALEAAQHQHHQHLQNQALAEERRNTLHDKLETLHRTVAELQTAFAQSDRKPLQFQEHEHIDSAQLQDTIRRLRNDIARLGAVNMAAVEAYAEADQEFQTLYHQCQDLQESLRLLEEAIAELDAQTQTRLSATFDAVNRSFGEYFPVLFRGGDAHLAWTDGDILNAGITIHVRPPGKNVKQLSVLSGGEKALTAVALVFAFFRLNPAPFCLLDEVDAPLDDANVARLNALLRDMARDTQFIMITHHKRSMQSCDHLIGVTMSEPGVSRLVAVKFEDAE